MNKNLIPVMGFVAIFISACAQNSSSQETKSKETASAQNTGAFEIFDGKKIVRSNEEWKKTLTLEQYNITREKGTEPRESSEYNKNHEKGIYYCVSCNLPLYSSENKFESGTGWPSFYMPIDPKNVMVAKDDSGGMERNEVLCPRCGAHLGHVFNDGPKPTGLRYCMDGVAMNNPEAEPRGIALLKKL